MRKHLAFWVPLLIPEWRVILTLGKSRKAMTSGGGVCDGLCWWSTEEAVAQIWIRRGAQMQEYTLVHELLHVRLEGHTEKTDHYDALYERALNITAEALLKLRHEDR